MRTLITLTLLLFTFLSAPAAEPPRILIIVGPSKHPPGSHECAAGARVLAHCLQSITNGPRVTTTVLDHWPQDKSLRDSVATVVFIGDTFPPNRLPNPAQNLADLEVMMARGCGIVCLHYATGVLGQDVTPEGDHPLLRWTGGYFANRSCKHHESIARIYPAATITPAAPAHPITRGWKQFTIHDEPYINNYFGPDHKLAPNVTAIATSLLPPESPKPETVAWCIDRPDPGKGRGFSIVMPHFYKNWRHEDLRRLILNATLWTSKLEVPTEGAQTPPPDLPTFNPEAVEYTPPPKKPATPVPAKS